MAKRVPFWPPEILARVKAARIDRGYTHEACARHLDLANSGQYSRRETGEYDFKYEEMGKLCQGLFRAPWPFPHVSLHEAYEFQAYRSGGAASVPLAAESASPYPVVPELLQAYSARRGPFSESLLLEMARRIRADVPWDDSDLDLLRLTAERQLRQGGQQQAPPTPASSDQSAPPRGKHRGGAGRR